MYSEVEVSKEKTKELFGYYPDELKVGSHKKVVVECKNCNRQVHREYRNVNSKHQCPSVEGSNKRCFKCGEWKDLSLFNKSRGLSGGVAKVCRNCFNRYESVKNNNLNKIRRLKHAVENGDIDYYIKKSLSKIKSRCLKCGFEFDLDFDFLSHMWHKQKGKCFYTNIPMSNSMKQSGFQSWDGPSLDRVDPSLGYIKSNVVWCIFAVNSFKQSLTIEQFKKAVESIDWRWA